MADKKQDSFTVTDRRLFTRRRTAPGRSSRRSRFRHANREPPTIGCASSHGEAYARTSDGRCEQMEHERLRRPLAAEQQEQADAYRKSSKEMDARVELSGHSAKATWR